MRTTKKSKMLLCFFGLLLTYFFILLPKVNFADEKYPTKPIKFIIPYAAGGATDVICRKLVNLVEKALGQEVIVDNRVGAGGTVGANIIAKVKPDGYTIGAIISSTFVIAPNFTKMDFDPLTAFTPIVQVFTANDMLGVPTNSPIKTLNEFIEEGRKRQITVATIGMMSVSHIAMQRLGMVTNINLKLVPFEGGAPAIMAALGGQVDAYVTGATSYEFVRAGKIRIIARLNPETKLPFKGVVPSLKELGYDIEAVGFLGIAGPKGLPEHIKKKLEEEFTRALHDPSIVEFIENSGQTWVFRNSNDFSNYLKEVYERSRKEIRELGLGIYAKDKK